MDQVLREMTRDFDRAYAKTGRPSIAPARLLRALLLQVLHSIRSERMLMEQPGLQPADPLVRGLEHGRHGVEPRGI